MTGPRGIVNTANSSDCHCWSAWHLQVKAEAVNQTHPWLSTRFVSEYVIVVIIQNKSHFQCLYGQNTLSILATISIVSKKTVGN